MYEEVRGLRATPTLTGRARTPLAKDDRFQITGFSPSAVGQATRIRPESLSVLHPR